MVAAQLLDELGRERGILDELLLLVRVADELDDAEVDHVDHGRVAGDEEEEGDLHGVGLVDVALAELLGHELADEVVLGLGGALVDEVGEIAQELLVGVLGLGGGGAAVCADCVLVR